MIEDRLFFELLGAVPRPLMVNDDIYTSEFDDDINRHLHTKQVIHLTSETVKNIIENNNVTLPEALKILVGNTGNSTTYDPDDGFGYSEYFGTHNKFVPNGKYFSHVVTNKTDAILNIYDGINADINVSEIQDQIRAVDLTTINLGEIPFPKIDKVKYVRIMESNMDAGFDVDKDKRYHPDFRIESYMFTFPVMTLNLPYEYYSKIEIPENIYTWDIDKNAYFIGERSGEEFIDYFHQKCISGFTTPLYMQIRQGKIISMSNNDYTNLLIAKWLKLPSIPAALYMFNNTGSENCFLLSGRAIDVINRDIPDLNPDQETLRMANQMCNPCFIFQDDRHMESLALRSDINRKYTQTFVYDSAEGAAIDSFMCSKDPNEDTNIYSDEEPVYVQQRLTENIGKQIDDDINEAFNKLLGN